MEIKDANALATLIVERQLDRLERDGKGFVRNDMIEEAVCAISLLGVKTEVERFTPQHHAASKLYVNREEALKGVFDGPRRRWSDHIYAAVEVTSDPSDLSLAASDSDSLCNAFLWGSTPQGHGYWAAHQKALAGGGWLGGEALDFLKGLIDYRKRMKPGGSAPLDASEKISA